MPVPVFHREGRRFEPGPDRNKALRLASEGFFYGVGKMGTKWITVIPERLPKETYQPEFDLKQFDLRGIYRIILNTRFFGKEGVGDEPRNKVCDKVGKRPMS